MYNVCKQCGEYRVDKTIDPIGPFAICPVCGYAHRFVQSPLFLVGGASGTGKTTTLLKLAGTIAQVVMLEGDVLWCPAFDHPANNYRDFFAIWLRLSKNIAQSGRPCVLFGGGMAVPGNLENCLERRYFSELHYLALICEDRILEERLLSRPDWRHANQAEFIQSQIAFNQWFTDKPNNPRLAIKNVDTTQRSIEETTEEIAVWIRSKLR